MTDKLHNKYEDNDDDKLEQSSGVQYQNNVNESPLVVEVGAKLNNEDNQHMQEVKELSSDMTFDARNDEKEMIRKNFTEKLTKTTPESDREEEEERKNSGK